jgi:hypothetical protein
MFHVHASVSSLPRATSAPAMTTLDSNGNARKPGQTFQGQCRR